MRANVLPPRLESVVTSDPDIRRFSDSPDKVHPEVPDVQYPKRLSDFVKSPYANESLKRRSGDFLGFSKV